MVVLSILAIVLTVVGVQGHRAYREQRFLTAADAATERFVMAQQLMLVHEMDVKLEFQLQHTGQNADKGVGWVLYLSTDRPLPGGMEVVLPSKLELPGIADIRIDGQEPHPIAFLTLDGRPPRAVISLYPASGEVRHIILEGTRRAAYLRSEVPVVKPGTDDELLNPLLFPEELREL